MKKNVGGIFERITRFKPKVYKSAHDGYEKNFRIEGRKGYDNLTLFNAAESKLINLYKRKKKPIKTTLYLTNEFIKKDPATGEVDKMEQHFHSDPVWIYGPTNIKEKYKEMRDVILEKAVSFQGEKSGRKSGRQFRQVHYLDINISPCTPIQPSSYIPTPERIRYRNPIINIQNRSDNKCFVWTMGSF